jgi:starch phosphorylase
LSSFDGGDGRVREGHATAIELFRATGEREGDGACVFANESTPPWCGLLSGAVRVVPYHALLSHRYELGLMRWL